MDVIALLSGGKDSCYTLYRARLHGHRVVAAAHVTPPREEADSFMYQSVGSTAVPYIAEALGLPLFTHRTEGLARHTDLAYTPTIDDEVEDLVLLLRKVKEAYPTLQAVCAGALWSDYQRLRVESAASRAGLLSLAYLWRREQASLLDEMIDAGLHAVIVKVAGVGLHADHLGKSLSEMRPTLRKLESLYGSHVCGEGGEYETTVLWMPGFTKRLVLQDVETIFHSEDPVAPVSYLRIVKCSLADLTEDQKSTALQAYSKSPKVPAPFLFQAEAAREGRSILYKQAEAEGGDLERFIETSIGNRDEFMHIIVRSPEDGKRGVSGAAGRLESILLSHGESLGDVVYMTVHLRSVSGSMYTSANAGYNEVFNVPQCTPPPSRACVGTFPGNHPTTLEALVKKKRNRRAPELFTMHVQSLSEWAPPCIGPYAQLIEEDGVLHVCGILPLYAPTASILKGMPIRKQVEACVYNLERTLEASRADISKLGLFVAYVTASELVEDVLEEMQHRVTHERKLIAILPVSELPKAAMVEIRAVGALKEEDLYIPDLSGALDKELQLEGVETRSVVCSKFGYVTTIARRKESPEMNYVRLIRKSLESVAFEAKLQPLSLQVYTTASCTNIEKDLRRSFPESAISTFTAAWMPREAGFVSLTTFSL